MTIWRCVQDSNLYARKDAAFREQCVTYYTNTAYDTDIRTRTEISENSDYSRLSKTIPYLLGLCRYMVGRVGADPTTHKATVLQTAEFADSLYLPLMVGEEGLEPSMFLMSRFYGPLPSPLGDSPE